VQITTADVMTEAGTMALELRFKDQAIAALEQQNAQLLARVAELEQPPTEA
jgi:hypothetical protein